MRARASDLDPGNRKLPAGAEVVDLTTDQSLARGQGAALEFHDRLGAIQFLLPLPPLPFHHAGSYEVIVFADGREIDRQKFTVSCSPAAGWPCTIW